MNLYGDLKASPNKSFERDAVKLWLLALAVHLRRSTCSLNVRSGSIAVIH